MRGLKLSAATQRALEISGFAAMQTGLTGDCLKQTLLQIGRGLGHIAQTRSEDIVHELRPLLRKDARNLSLSRLTGQGEQPWHVDGAHLDTPYRYVVFASPLDQPHLAKTQVCEAAKIADVADIYDLETIIYVFTSGARSFYSTIKRERQFFRLDPGCMKCPTNRSRELLSRIAYARLKGEHSIRWSKGMLLILDNHRMLHRRMDASAESERVLYRVSIV
jgi:alpha-ketoglutarate-dependent taurine dioxygenase